MNDCIVDDVISSVLLKPTCSSPIAEHQRHFSRSRRRGLSIANYYYLPSIFGYFLVIHEDQELILVILGILVILFYCVQPDCVSSSQRTHIPKVGDGPGQIWGIPRLRDVGISKQIQLMWQYQVRSPGLLLCHFTGNSLPSLREIGHVYNTIQG